LTNGPRFLKQWYYSIPVLKKQPLFEKTFASMRPMRQGPVEKPEPAVGFSNPIPQKRAIGKRFCAVRNSGAEAQESRRDSAGRGKDRFSPV